MQAMPAIPTDIKATPAHNDRPTPAGREGSGFRDHLNAATGRHKGPKGGDDDGRKPAAAAAETPTQRTEHRHGSDSHRAGRKERATAEGAGVDRGAAAAAEKAAEQTAGPAQVTEQASGSDQVAERQRVSSMAALLAALTGEESSRTGARLEAMTADADAAAVPGQAGRVNSAPLRAGTSAAATPAPVTLAEQPPAATGPASDNKTPSPGRAEITVDHWSATFSSRTATAKATGPATAAAASPGTGSTIGQTLVSVQRIPENEEILPPSPTDARAPQMDTGGQRQDINSSYIHANLPNQATRGDAGSGNNQQPGGDRPQDGPDFQAGSEQIRQQGPADNGSQPLVFSLDQAGGVSPAGGHQATTVSVPLHQTAGLPVSDTHVMDQVIQRFGGDRQLESGTVVLRLHPQELGELRMEIKVEQDNIKAHITTNNPQVQDILDRHLPRLREALEQQGLSLEQMQVSVATGDNSDTQLFQEHRSPQRQQRPARSVDAARSIFTIPEEDDRRQRLVVDDLSLSIHA